ncbi:MAG: hypothetical protein FWE48_05430, partial [Coriobacteriia bacterium]|nr:hypothetical protein [Coriobacteriia bacterium]
MGKLRRIVRAYWFNMVDVLSRVPSEISHAKRPVSLYISGMLLLGLSAIPELYFIPGVIGSVLLVASFY